MIERKGFPSRANALRNAAKHFLGIDSESEASPDDDVPIHALPKKRPSITQHSLRASHTGQGRVAPAEGRGRASPPDSPVDEPYDAWRARYWEPRLASRRAERRARSRELHSQSSVYSWAASGSFDDDGEAAV